MPVNEPDDGTIARRKPHAGNRGSPFEAGKTGCHPATLQEVKESKETGRIAV